MNSRNPISGAHTPVLKISNLTLVTRDNTPVVADLSLAIGKGELLAVVGESGSGKTMAARAVMGLLPPGISRQSGRIELGGRDLTNAHAAEMRKLRGGALGMVFQEPLTSLNPALRIGPQLIEALRLHQDIDEATAYRRAIEMLDRVRVPGAADLLRSYPHEFSGGMRQRILLASVLLNSPDLIIADEPTTALDTLSEKEVLDLMAELGRELGVGIMLITHNLALAARYANEVAVMKKGIVVETGTVNEVLHAPQEEYTRELLAALPEPSSCAEQPAVSRKPLLSARNLSVEYSKLSKPLSRSGKHRALDDVSVEIGEGEIVAVVGGSGSGKTTLGRAIIGLVPVASGSIVFDDEACSTPRTQDFRQRTQMIFQDPFSSLDPRLRVSALVAESLRLSPWLSAAEKRERVQTALSDVGLAGLEARFPHQLSGGQRQRVAIARAIVAEPELVIADEPISALDMSIQAQVLNLFVRLQKERGFACLFISHDLAAVGKIADRIVVMERGKVVEAATTTDVLNRPKHGYTRALIDAAPVLNVDARAAKSRETG